MAIRDYKPFRNTIRISDRSEDTVTLRAINYHDISRIFQLYEDQLEEVFVKIVGPNGEFDISRLFQDIFGTIRTVIVVAPGALSELILVSADEDEDDEARVAVQMMSVEDQTRIIAEIVRLSATSEGGLGKLLDVVKRAVAMFAVAASEKTAAAEVKTTKVSDRAERLGLKINPTAG